MKIVSNNQKEWTTQKSELKAAFLATELTPYLSKTFEILLKNCTVLLDSQAALYWIKTPIENLTVFHANTVAKILNYSIKFRYLESSSNFADVLTKKFSINYWITPRSEKEWDIFFNFWLGPSSFSVQFFEQLLVLPKIIDPSSYSNGIKKNAKVLASISKCGAQTSILNLTISRHHVHKSITGLLLKDRFSSITKFTGVLALVLRFVAKVAAKLPLGAKLKHNDILLSNSLSFYSDKEERAFALKLLIREEQQKYFAKEVALLRAGDCIDKESVLRSYSPQIDNMGVLYARTRLDNLDESLYHLIARDPIILPGKSEITSKIIMHVHLSNKHSNLKTTLAILRSEYLIFHPRITVKTSLKECTLIQCRLPHLVPFQARMSNLPTLKLKKPIWERSF